MKLKNKILVVTPTYNEAENAESFIKAILRCIPSVDILIVDDNSPDKTAMIVKSEKLKAKSWRNRVYLLERAKKLGLGTAYRDGFWWAQKRGYDFVVSMDADFSHDPKFLKNLISAPKRYDIVIGSRYIRGGRVVGWGVDRYLNSYLANWLTRLALGLKQKDATAGFKRYSAKFIKYLLTKKLVAPGYAFQVETLFYAKEGGFSVFELPITFVDRRAGQSKIAGEVVKSAKVLWRLFSRRRGVRQFIKFAVVGAINTAIDWTFFYFLKVPFGSLGQLGKQLSKAGSFVVAGSSSYIMNRRWTFRSQDGRVARQLAKFFLVAIIGLTFNNLIFYFATSPTYLSLPDILGLIIATGLVTFWNFSASKYWTFR